MTDKLTIVTSDLSSSMGIRSNFVRNILSGTARQSDIRTFEQYRQIYRIRHDAIHSLVCNKEGVPFGERHMSDIKEIKEIKDDDWDIVKRQSPDIVITNGPLIKIIEITISSMSDAEVGKISKYSLLKRVLERNGYEVNIKVIVIGTSVNRMDEWRLKRMYNFDDDMCKFSRELINNTFALLHSVHSTDQGQIWYKQFHEITTPMTDLKFSDEDVISYYGKFERKSFYDEDDLKSILTSDEPESLTSNDEKFIEKLTDYAMNSQPPLIVKNDPDIVGFRNKLLSQKNTDHKPLILPIPLIYPVHYNYSMERSTWDDEMKVSHLKRLFLTTSDPLLQILAKTGPSVMFRKAVPKSIQRIIALEGPGRKKFIHEPTFQDQESKSHNRNIGLIDDITSLELEQLSYYLSGRKEETPFDPDLNLGPGLEYVRVCQEIFQEVTINANRRSRRRQWILKPTGLSGIYVLLHPGPKLRTGEAVSQVWFKIISDHSSTDIWTHRRFFPHMTRDGSISHTRWLSTDANRLDHYIRCFDRVLMAYCSYLEQIYTSIQDGWRSDSSNTLGMIILTYMEDKRMTSKLLQDVRFIIMGVLSFTANWSDHLKKMDVPIRSTLQSYYLKRMLSYIEDRRTNQLVALKSRVSGSSKLDPTTQTMDDEFAGATFKMPRILTRGEDIPFSGILCEMYFTMLFNKNQDDPTHSSFQILNKMLLGEQSLEEVKSSTGLHLGGTHDSIGDLETIINSPHRHQFSRRAIIIGSKLQAIDPQNNKPSGLSYDLASIDKILNKPLEEFGTFKSSAVTERLVLEPKLMMFRTGNATNDQKRYGIQRQNPRRRCLQGVLEYAKKGFCRSFDLIPEALSSHNCFQVFKKNQIGGVREILILEMNKRILINILESFMRKLCTYDDREMLTCGRDKYKIFSNVQKVQRRKGVKSMVVNYNFDKSKWGPTFVPIQFIYTILPYKRRFPNLFRLFLLILINHTNKRCMFPEHLIRAWCKDPFNEKKHEEPLLQSLKEKFLQDKELYFTNESNMGQGILHYTSSFSHVCMLSLRDSIYKRMCIRHGIDPGDWSDLVSSDDSYTCQSVPMDQNMKKRIRCMMQAQYISELVFNMRTSGQKSSLSTLVSEFNSLFGSNLTMYPTTFKFGLSSVLPQNTDSFFRMVKESYISSRQIFENGGSLELYYLSHRLNKNYCERMYHTSVNSHNSLEALGLNMIPYHLGHYPLGDPAIMLMLGPEFHNYWLLENIDKMSDRERNLFYNSHRLIDTNNPEIFAEVDTFDNLYVSTRRIEAVIRPIRRLERIKREESVNQDELYDFVSNDIMFLFRPSENSHDVIKKIHLKLCQSSAAEALRITASSIFFARLAATVNKDIFKVTGTEIFRKSYSDCIQKMCEPTTPVDLTPYYPYMNEFRTLQRMSMISIDYQPRDPMATKSLRKFMLNEVHVRIRTSLVDLFTANWTNKPKTNAQVRDWINLKSLVPMIEDSYDETLANFQGTQHEKTMKLLLMILRLHGYSSKPLKCVAYGYSTRSYVDSYLLIKQRNMFSGLTNRSHIDFKVTKSIVNVDNIHLLYNYIMLYSRECDTIANVRGLIDDELLLQYCVDPSRNYVSKKKILMLLITQGLLTNVSDWTRRSQTVLHRWLIRQPATNYNKFGPEYTISLQFGSTILMVRQKSGRLRLHSNRPNHEEDLTVILNHMMEILGMTWIEIQRATAKGPFIYEQSRLMRVPEHIGILITKANLQSIQLYMSHIEINDDTITLYDQYDSIIMRTSTGLLPTNITESKLPDFTINGLKFSDLLMIGAFKTQFDFDVISKKRLIDILPDLDAPVMPVTETTKVRLGRINRWPERSFADYSLVNVETVTQLASVEEKTELASDEKLDLMSFLLDDVEELKEDLALFNQTPMWLDVDIDSSFIEQLMKETERYRPREIWHRIVAFKYYAITRCVTNIREVSKSTIFAAFDMTGSVGIRNSMIFVYDRLYDDCEISSPDDIRVHIEEDLRLKFNLNTDNDQW